MGHVDGLAWCGDPSNHSATTPACHTCPVPYNPRCLGVIPPCLADHTALCTAPHRTAPTHTLPHPRSSLSLATHALHYPNWASWAA